jgi:hypothetical protein
LGGCISALSPLTTRPISLLEFALQQLALISRSREGLLAAEGMCIRFAAPAQTVFFSAKCTVVHLALVEKVISRYAGMDGFVKEYFHILDLFCWLTRPLFAQKRESAYDVVTRHASA